MLPRAARLTSGRDFAETVRHGRRSGTRSLVVHLDVGHRADGRPAGGRPVDGHPDDDRQAVAGPSEPSRAGLVVSRAVGGSVVRNRVKRRLRHLLPDRLVQLPPASRVVVRALPAAADASSDELDRDLRRAVDRALDRSAPRSRG